MYLACIKYNVGSSWQIIIFIYTYYIIINLILNIHIPSSAQFWSNLSFFSEMKTPPASEATSA